MSTAMVDSTKIMSATQIPLNDTEFRLLQRLFYDQVGIQLPPVKRPLICGRLAKRLAALHLSSYQQYYKHLVSDQGASELEIAIDLITTHETYFFREPQHFQYLQEHILPPLRGNAPFRVWSAASSTGEEAFTLAMVLAEHRSPKPWAVVATDISQAVLHSARKGLFSLGRGDKIPPHYLKRYCLKGHDRYDGYFLIERTLREQVEFLPGNLTKPCPELGLFDLIMLRNVLIYFDQATKQQVLKHVLDRLKPGGWLMVGHSESLQGLPLGLEPVAPSIYRKHAR
jgi:chemotaxis protein methyltransferase CheR